MLKSKNKVYLTGLMCIATLATAPTALAGTPNTNILPVNPVSDALVNPLEQSLDPYDGFPFRGKLIADLSQVVDQIWTGYKNSVNGKVITYNFAKGDHLTGLYNNPNYGFTAGFGLGQFSETQKASARKSVQFWDDLIAAKFVEKGARGADIQFANSYDPAQAYAYYPEYDFTNANGWKFFGDVFVASPDVNWTNEWLGYGGYGVTTVIHEVGHSLGLSHPGAYNGAGATNYLSQAEYAQDSEQYTLMSYWGNGETSNQPFSGIVDWSSGFYNNAQTPLVHDILAVQAAYGADATTRTDDTTYGWNSNASNEVYDFTQNHFPYLSIYDAGGNDTIDMSGADVSVFIDLNDGAFSSAAGSVPDESVINAKRQAVRDAGGNVADVNLGTSAFWQFLTTTEHEAYLAFETGVSGLYVTSHDNLSIAYGTTIENAIGSSQRDFLKGNEVDNVLTGNAGSDVYEGGAGADTFVITDVGFTDAIYDFTSGEDSLDLSALSSTLTYIGNSAFSGTAGELSYDGTYLLGDIDGDGFADMAVYIYSASLLGSDLLL